MTDDDTDASEVRTLATIARTLGVPIEIFFDPVAQVPAAPPEAEEAEVVRLFRAIRDPQQRSRCLALIRGMAGVSGDVPGAR